MNREKYNQNWQTLIQDRTIEEAGELGQRIKSVTIRYWKSSMHCCVWEQHFACFFVLMENDLWVIPLGELSEGLKMKWHSEMREMASKNAQEFFSSFQQTFTMCLS